ncbi:hypothetical protein BMI86_00075 [Thioclava sp. DLFJ5-1]|uniref:hypothetical protein n=1 Tax=Thioclava sp. DLFJ5-1 TaxID=1915314 RepID=UPI000996D768|nr:hypothetical protein [Thioclava sp. DLFJ5-1]OOY21032.1 hypothetical protein BMI86_00075 [Thioclava sp. DLFJ5-1]
MRPALAILLDHQVAHLLRAHDLEAHDLARMLTGAPPTEPEQKPDPAAERRAVRDQVLIACADRLDPDRERSVRSIFIEIRAAYRTVNSQARPTGRGIEPLAWELRRLQAAGLKAAMPGYETFRRLLVANGWPSPGKGGRFPRNPALSIAN